MASSGPGHGRWRGGSSRLLRRQPHRAVASSASGGSAVAHRAVGLWWGGSGSGSLI